MSSVSWQSGIGGFLLFSSDSLAWAKRVHLLGDYTSRCEDTNWFHSLHTYNPERAPKVVPRNKALFKGNSHLRVGLAKEGCTSQKVIALTKQTTVDTVTTTGAYQGDSRN